MQELFVPMAVLRVKPQDQGIVVIERIEVPTEVLEGEDLTAHIHVRSNLEDLRVDVEASWSNEPEGVILPGQVHYLNAGSHHIRLTFKPEAAMATSQERKLGVMRRALQVTLLFRDGRKALRRSLTKDFAIRLNLERVARRVPPALGNILGMTPKGLK